MKYALSVAYRGGNIRRGVTLFLYFSDEPFYPFVVVVASPPCALLLAAIMHDARHFSDVLSERALAIRPAGSV